MMNLTLISNANAKNDLIKSVEEVNKLKLEKIIESAIHWSLVNGQY